jgi:hypothetical protein
LSFELLVPLGIAVYAIQSLILAILG